MADIQADIRVRTLERVRALAKDRWQDMAVSPQRPISRVLRLNASRILLFARIDRFTLERFDGDPAVTGTGHSSDQVAAPTGESLEAARADWHGVANQARKLAGPQKVGHDDDVVDRELGRFDGTVAGGLSGGHAALASERLPAIGPYSHTHGDPVTRRLDINVVRRRFRRVAGRRRVR